MKILSLNIRGFGDNPNGKWRWVKDLIQNQMPDVVMLQETKLKEKKNHFLASRGNWLGSSVDTVLINIYGPHSDMKKKIMWDDLDNVMELDNVAWVLGGDFNEVRYPTERRNCNFIEHRARLFNEFTDQNKLLEIPMGGKMFTRVSDDGTKFSKLDRFLVSDRFLEIWEGLATCALERKHSDHCPIILKDGNTDFGPKPIRVYDNWIEQEGSLEVINSGWEQHIHGSRFDCRFWDKLKNVKSALKEKGNRNFGVLNDELKKLQDEVLK
ncbi:uncharacterized protein [Rutidosis leptorrhynchoides]|uniref:uncharacterized protein n=1 Tax=Rutidosis leptorrhynchoides TaxID=125765 RepID=UPI003A98EBFA